MSHVPLLSALLAGCWQAVEAAHHWLCHPWVSILQFHGIVPGLLLGTLWLLSGWVRLQELRRLRARRAVQAKAAPTEKVAPKQPAVTVVFPVRGCRSHSLSSWRAALALQYDGLLEFLFVLESAADPAHPRLAELAREQEAAGAAGRSVRLVLSGQAAGTSQKIHNLIAGVREAAPAAHFVLCLDDDVQLQPGVLTRLVQDMQADSTLAMATGYPFDVPPPGAGLLAYAVMSYHQPLVIAFSVRQRIGFVWGGFMLFRAQHMRTDAHGIIKAWSSGGYSDDLTVASKCTEQRLDIYCPSYAIFPQWLDSDYGLARWWNYLRRQLYVLDTYSNPHNRRTNHAMALLHCYGSWGFLAPLATASLRLALWLAVSLLASVGGTAGSGQPGYGWSALLGSGECRGGLASWLAFAGFTAYMAAALHWMTGVVLDLMLELDPGLARHQLYTFNWWGVWAGFVFSNAAVPLCMVYTFATKRVVWSGITYTRRRGKVVHVQHGPAH